MIIIGLDGGSWHAIQPLLDSGLLPNLQSLVVQGTCGKLNSIIPPVTGPAWPALATGLNPGKLGTYDFYNRTSLEDTALLPVRSYTIKEKAFWDRLSKGDRRFGVFGYPMLVPAYDINGWMVAGLGASKFHEWARPSSLKNQLEKIANPFTFMISYGQAKYLNNIPELLNDIKQYCQGQFAVVDYLLDKYPVDVLMAVFGTTDFLSHTMWHLWDESHPHYDPGTSTKYLPIVKEIWSEIDRGIGRLHKRLAPHGHLVCLSDHGFGQSYGVFHTNSWLLRNGFLVKRKQFTNLNNKWRGKLVSTLGPVLNPIFKWLQGSHLHQSLRESVLREIDLVESRAFALETTDVYGMVFINRQYAALHDLDEDQFVVETANEICERLGQYGKAEGLKIQATLAKDLYWGEYSHLAPEVLFQVDDSRVSVSYRFCDRIYEKRLHKPMKTGNHRREGIFLGVGPKFKVNTFLEDPLNLIDIAPTFYHLLDQPIPHDVDGRVVVEAMHPEFQQFTTIDYGENPTCDQSGIEAANFDESAELIQRLRDLGYLD
jgi:predicted AlkP superfamily phosphohydrolase/phosphomutase